MEQSREQIIREYASFCSKQQESYYDYENYEIQYK